MSADDAGVRPETETDAQTRTEWLRATTCEGGLTTKGDESTDGSVDPERSQARINPTLVEIYVRKRRVLAGERVPFAFEVRENLRRTEERVESNVDATADKGDRCRCAGGCHAT